ncbi:MAG: ATP-dependent dethiobiotin synthetase BioD [Micrococcales bacterium]|nr:ATP-dependent dethiobiotin synthetase BioD [Micrococcales bacterium]
MSVLGVTGTGTEVGKTIVTAAIAALCPDVVTVLKPAQTGLPLEAPGDVDVVHRLVPHVETMELVRYPDPLAPAAAARRSGIPTLSTEEVLEGIEEADADLVLIEGAGGLLVRFSDDPVVTFADVLVAAQAPTVLVTSAGLGTLNQTALTLEAMAGRGIECAGVVIGAWPTQPDLACVTNVRDLTELIGGPLSGVLPEGMGGLPPEQFTEVARAGLSPRFGGRFDADRFGKRVEGLL